MFFNAFLSFLATIFSDIYGVGPKKANELVEKHDIKISLEGNYTQILSFIRDIELLENIVLIGDFEIIGLDDVSKVDKVRIRYNSKISVFGNIIIPPEKKQNI